MQLAQTEVVSIQNEGTILPAVAVVQYLLNQHGYGPLAEDGDFGPITQQAVKKFQGDKHLTVDGVVGPQTWRALLQEPADFQVEATLPLINAASADTSYVTVGLAVPGATPKPFGLVFDSGAFELLLNAALAAAIGTLPNLGQEDVSGVDAQALNAYRSQVDVTLGTRLYKAVPCVVYDGPDNLWGLRFAEDNGYSWAWDKASARVIYYTGKFPA